MLKDDFLKALQKPCEGVLGEFHKRCLDEGLPVIPLDVANFLQTILSVKRPRNVLEIGCCVGFSAMLISRFLEPGGHITTIDRYECMIKDAKENFKRYDLMDKVTLLEGNATDIVPTLEPYYDFIFLDAAKGQYLTLLPHCIRLLSAGGIFIADDVLQNGNIAAERLEIPRRQRTIHTRMRSFFKELNEAPELNACILPIGDGVAFACKKEM